MNRLLLCPMRTFFSVCSRLFAQLMGLVGNVDVAAICVFKVHEVDEERGADERSLHPHVQVPGEAEKVGVLESISTNKYLTVSKHFDSETNCKIDSGDLVTMQIALKLGRVFRNLDLIKTKFITFGDSRPWLLNNSLAAPPHFLVICPTVSSFMLLICKYW
jgi:hypothetical protein